MAGFSDWASNRSTQQSCLIYCSASPELRRPDPVNFLSEFKTSVLPRMFRQSTMICLRPPAILLLCACIPPQCFALSPGEEALLKLVGRENSGTVIPLWPGDGRDPNEVRRTTEEEVIETRASGPTIKNVTRPSLTVVPPPAGTTSSGTLVLYAPGGGYGILGLATAADICRWSNATGAHFAMLKYRVPKAPEDPGRRMPLRDAQRAVRVLRLRAKKLGFRENKIIVVGASAGGHLSFNLACNYDEATYAPIDDADQLSARPDAVVLLYPAYLTSPTNSLKTDPWLNPDRVDATRTPPVFMAVTRPDKFTGGAISTLLNLRKKKIPTELHIYPDGGHGGCFNKYPFMEFVRPAARFLKDQRLFSAGMQKAGDQWLDALEAKFLTRPQTPAFPESAGRISGAANPNEWTPADRRLAELRSPAPNIIPLWPGSGTRADDPGATLQEELPEKPDGLVRVTKVSRPTLHHWPAQHADGRAVLVFPGGAYNGLAAQHEGTEIAAWLNQQGLTAFVTKYRVPRREGLEKHTVALQDAQRAIRLVRAQADEFGIHPDRVGVLGFSAGGNLAALTVHQATQSAYKPVDKADSLSARPDFAVLIYPAYLTVTREGPQTDPLIAPLSSRKAYPPIFTAVAADDPFAPGSLYYLLHLHQAKVPGELHVYEKGGHGKGLQQRGYPFSQWTKACERWLADLKYGTTKIIVE